MSCNDVPVAVSQRYIFDTISSPSAPVFHPLHHHSLSLSAQFPENDLGL
jgi:hypothetical protein